MKCGVVVLAVLLTQIGAAPPQAPASAGRAFDFDRDGRQDIVAGAPGWSIRRAPNAGAVFVLSDATRDGRTRARVLSQASPGVPGRAEGDDHWGTAVASDDFDGDGYADLAVAAPGDDVVVIFRGSRAGLRVARAQSLRTSGTLAAGDLDGDGYGDLAVGRPPTTSVPPDSSSRSIRLFFGSRDGLRRQRTLVQARRTDHGFGTALALGDVDGDGHRDLIEVAPGTIDDVSLDAVPGHASYCVGGPRGPRRCLPVGVPLEGGPTTVAVGDVDCDGFADIVAGAPVDRFLGEDDEVPPGSLRLWRGTAGGPHPVPELVTQDLLQLADAHQPAAGFGTSIVVAQLDGDGCADIVVGAPGTPHAAAASRSSAAP